MKRFVLFCALTATALPAAAFEGVVTSRRISLKPAAIAKVLGVDAAKPERILDVPVDKLLAEKEGVETRTSSVSIRGSKVRVEAAAETFVIMDAATGTMRVISYKDKRVMEMTREEMKSAAEQLAQRSKPMQEQLDKLPPEKRKEVEAMLKKAESEKDEKNAPKLRELGRVEAINGYKCSAHEVQIGGEKTVGWITSDAKDLAEAFRAFAAAERAIRPGPKNARMLIAEKGLPMRMQTLTDGGYQLDEIVKIEPKAIGEDIFQTPADFVKVDAAGMIGGAKPKPQAPPH